MSEALKKTETEEEFTANKWTIFTNTGLLWWINRSLSLFGWAITVSYDSQTGECLGAEPIRTNARGFNRDTEEENFLKLTSYMKDNASELFEEIQDE